METLFLEQLDLIQRLIAKTCKRQGVAGEQAKDFASSALLKLIEDDYAVLRRFQGKSRLSTYLTTVIQHLFQDFRNHELGKWRPSAAARKLGPEAIQLENLLVRDGYSLDEAVEIMLSNHRVPRSRQELHKLAAALPPRWSRRFEGESSLARLPAPEVSDEELGRGCRQQMILRTRALLAKALVLLEPEERMVLKMHYQDGASIASIAATLGHKQRSLYTLRKRCLKQLRRAFDQAGLEWEEARGIIGHEDTDLGDDFLARACG